MTAPVDFSKAAIIERLDTVEAAVDAVEGVENISGLGTLLTAGLGATGVYTKTTDGAQTLLAKDVNNDRAVLIVCTVTEDFAQDTGTKPTFTVGQTGAATKFAATTVFASGTVGQVFVLAGTLTKNTDLLVTAVAGTGDGTGGLTCVVLALNAAPAA